MKAICKWANGCLLLLQRVEEFILFLLLISMIMLAVVQIVLRSVFSGGFLWADPLLRYMVLWAGMFGAVVATRTGKHISLDFISHLLPAGWKAWLQLLIHFFSSLVCAALTWASFSFVRDEARFGGTSLLSVPSWGWNLVFPLAFALITFRFCVALLEDIVALAGKSMSNTP